MTFSITISAYKATFLIECIDSILAQTVSDFELIILNDASPEGIDEIVNGYSDSRIKYYKNEINCGALNLVDNWNKCLELASGEFVICMGDDDKLLPNCLEEYEKLIKKYPSIDVFHAWTEIINEKSEFFRLQEARPEYESVYSMIWHRWEGRYQYIGDFLFRRNTLKSKGGFVKLPLAWASDDLTSYTMAIEHGVVNSQVPLFQYRVSSQTISSTGGLQYKMDALSQEIEWYESFFKTKPEKDIDLKFWLMLCSKLSTYSMKKKIFRIRVDIVSSPVKRLIFWFLNKKAYNVSTVMIIKGFIDAVPEVFNFKK